MKVLVKRFDKSLPLPEYKTSGAAAFDLYARQDTLIPAHKVVLVPLNIAIQLPTDHWALLSARSSLHKMGLMVANGIGVGDYDYRGDNDEYMAALLNFTDQEVMVKKGDRVVQMIIMSRERVEFEELDKFETEDRGGFGSTGK
ncbi:MAG: dUTP diphosphatase [Candidatus Pacebacteria bacterium]|nr:dUTP diphosphatase [Candidatus Paceibacterota bacterium]